MNTHQPHETPSWTRTCSCGSTISRFRGQMTVRCIDCGAQYTAGGQRLRSDWRGNSSHWDDEISDLEGYESQHAGDR